MMLSTMPMRIVEGPVYITKWATTHGIVVFSQGGTASGDNYEYFKGITDGWNVFEGPRHWTTDKAIAVKRYHEAVAKKLAAAQKAVKKAQKLIGTTPTFKDA